MRKSSDFLMRQISKFAILLVITCFPYISQAKDHEKMKEIRVRLSYRLPHDPLEIKTMADYDLSLLLSDTWFDYDSSRKAKSNLISSWSFDSKTGAYHFKVNPEKKWSNGHPLKASELLWNLKRAVKLKTQYGNAIESIINFDTIKILGESEIIIQTRDKMQSESFFQRMGGQSLAIINPGDVDPKSLNVISNNISIGPFFIANIDNEQIKLERNQFYQKQNENSPDIIFIKKTDPNFKLENFLKGNSWENIVQVNSFLNSETEKLMSEKKLPFWTRAHDRVSLLKPLKNSNIEKIKMLLPILYKELAALKIDHLPLNVKKATSLQPIGYPLFDRLESKDVLLKSDLIKEVKILTINSQSNILQIEILNKIFNKINIHPKWEVLEKNEAIKKMYSKNDFDLVLFDFGVADPEPSTWIGIITSNEFINLEKDDLKKFQTISKITNIEKEVVEFKNLLSDSFHRGNYIPLFHFSTLSIGGNKDFDFSQIKDLDETVNYSKIIIK